MSIIYDVQYHDTEIADGEKDAKKACKALMIAIPSSPPALYKKRSDVVGLTAPRVTKIESGKPHRDGAPDVVKTWKCLKTKKTYDSKEKCKKHCKSDAPNPSDPSNPLSPVHNDPCASHVTVQVKYTIHWDYTVNIDVYRLKFTPALHDSTKKKEVKEWNEKIVEHEDHHVDDAKKACDKILEEESTITVSGSGSTEEEALSDAQNELIGSIAKKKIEMLNKCKDEIDRAAKAFHTLESKVSMPGFCE